MLEHIIIAEFMTNKSTQGDTSGLKPKKHFTGHKLMRDKEHPFGLFSPPRNSGK